MRPKREPISHISAAPTLLTRLRFRRFTLPVLTHVLATIDNAGLTLTDPDHWLETRVPAIIGPFTPGRVLMPAEALKAAAGGDKGSAAHFAFTEDANGITLTLTTSCCGLSVKPVCSLHGVLAAAEATSVDVFVNRDQRAQRGLNLTVPAGTNDLRFFVKPKSLSVRYKLEGLDEDWSQQADTIFLRVVFFNQKGDPIQMDPFPASGRSAGWRKTLEDSDFTPRVEGVTMPPDAVSMSLTMTTAGPASLVGIYAIRDMRVSSMGKSGAATKILMAEGKIPEGPKVVWNKSGTHPSMAVL